MSSTTAKRIEIALWITGAGCLLFWVIVKTQATLAQTSAVAAMQALSSQELRLVPDQSQWSAIRIAEYEASLQQQSGMPALAVLEIPTLAMEVAVFNGTSNKVLNLGIGRIPGTARVGQAGNLALAGHRDGYFRPLKELAVGDAIVLRHPHGIEHYQVTDLLIVQPDDVSVLDPTDTGTLTLVTCYPFYFVGEAPQRYIVVADKQPI